MAAARRHALARRVRVTLAYVCIAGVNMSQDDARALGELIGDTPVRLDLIEVTDHTGRFAPPGAAELRSFRDSLSLHVGQPIVRRYSGGKDIRAACGTLAGERIGETDGEEVAFASQRQAVPDRLALISDQAQDCREWARRLRS